MSAPTSRHATLVRALLALAVGAGAFWASARFAASDAEGSVVEAVTVERGRSAPSVVAVSADAAPIGDPSPQTRLEPDVLHNPFAQLNLRPPASATLGAPDPAKVPAKPKVAAPVEPPPPPPPMAPPLPFTAIGSIEGADATSGQAIAFLQQQDTLLVVRKGESIGQLYRVESVSAEKVEFTYLPLNQRQSLSFLR